MTRDDMLIGWLCIARHQFSNGETFNMPKAVSVELIERGWLVECGQEDGCDEWNAHITDLGLQITDLNAPEWGIDSIPQETEA